MKASPGRGKLSPQVTDEGADKQQLTGKLPLIRLLTAFAATFPPRGEGICHGSCCKIDFRENSLYLLYKP